jgi:hypothetical protein
MDAGLVATNPITATGSVFNNTDKNINARLLTVLYNANGAIADYQLSPTAVIVPEDNVTYSDKLFMPADVTGKYVRSFLIDADTFEEIGTDASYPAGTAGTSPSAVGIGGVLIQGGSVTGKGLFKNDTETPISAFILFARYNAKGELVEVKPGTAIEAKPGAITLFDVDYDLPAGTAGQTVKAFLWNATTYVPLVSNVSQVIS